MQFKEIFRITKTTRILGLLTALLLAGVYLLARFGAMNVYCNLADMEKSNIPSFSLSSKLVDIFHRNLSPAFIVAGNYEEDREIVRTAKEYLKKHRDASFSNVIGLSSLVPDEQQRKKEILAELVDLSKRVPKSKRGKIEAEIDNIKHAINSEIIEYKDVPETVKIKFLPRNSSNRESLVMFSPSASRDTPETINKFADEIGNLTFSSGKPLQPAGEFIILSDILKMISRDASLVLVLSLTAVFVILIIGLRSFDAALMVLLPLLGSFFITVIFMQILNIRLNIFNIIIFPVVLGTGADSLIHIYVKYLREKGVMSVNRVVRHLLSSLNMAAGTTVFGFGALVFADHDGLESIGWLAMLFMSITFLVTVFFFPYLIRFAEWLNKKKEYIADDMTVVPE